MLLSSHLCSCSSVLMLNKFKKAIFNLIILNHKNAPRRVTLILIVAHSASHKILLWLIWMLLLLQKIYSHCNLQSPALILKCNAVYISTRANPGKKVINTMIIVIMILMASEIKLVELIPYHLIKVVEYNTTYAYHWI